VDGLAPLNLGGCAECPSPAGKVAERTSRLHQLREELCGLLKGGMPRARFLIRVGKPADRDAPHKTVHSLLHTRAAQWQNILYQHEGIYVPNFCLSLVSLEFGDFFLVVAGSLDGYSEISPCDIDLPACRRFITSFSCHSNRKRSVRMTALLFPLVVF
jgi:hypothetical protein